MKNNDAKGTAALADSLRRVFCTALAGGSTLVGAGGTPVSRHLRHGFHSHDAWELFCVLRGSLRYEVAGQAPARIAAGQILMVPPGCLHVITDLTAQPRNLNLLVVNLPGQEGACGALRIGGPRHGFRYSFSEQDLAAWTALLGEPPSALMDRAAQALGHGPWGQARAQGYLRVLLAAYAQVATQPDRSARAAGARRVTEALDYLQSHYFESGLSLGQIASAVGLSPSHLSALVRKTTGQTLHRALIDLRLRRALVLLASTAHSIKEIAALTGWSHQLYFSSAVRKRYGRPPSALRAGRDASAAPGLDRPPRSVPRSRAS